MSVSETLPAIEYAPRDYTPEKGVFVAEQFAGGESLRQLSLMYPDYLPAALYMKKWRNEYPGFDMLMIAAEAALADLMVEQSTTIADNIKIPAAHAANSIKIRLSRAAALDQNVYGNKRIIAGDPDNPLLVGKAESLSDEELMIIARGGVIEHRQDAPPAPPLLGETVRPLREVRDTPTPATTSGEDSVTTSNEVIKKGIVKVDPGF